jgi:hypothetical protein
MKIHERVYLLLFFMFILLQTTIVNTFKCGTDSLEKHQTFYMNTNSKHFNISQHIQGYWQPIRIHADWSQIDNKIEKFSLPHVNYLKQQVIPRTIKILQNLVKVRPLISNLKLSKNPCGKITKIPDLYLNKDQGVQADLVIFVTLDETGTYEELGTEASALHCFQDDYTGRPIAGYVTYKPTFPMQNSTNLEYMTWLTLHELTHVLAFNDGLMDDWRDENNNRLGKKNILVEEFVWGNKNHRKIFLKTDNVKRLTRKHFNCMNIYGLPLENKGGSGTAGSHWAKRYMNTDYMTGDTYGENMISEMTLGVFEDSGWYKTNYTLANDFYWGKNAGCFFLSRIIPCVSFILGRVFNQFRNSYCDKLDQPVCSTHYQFRGKCATRTYSTAPKEINYFPKNRGGVSTLMDRCPIPIEEDNGWAFHGGSCRDGYDKNLKVWEKVCQNCACFEGLIIDKTKITKKIVKEKPNQKQSKQQKASFIQTNSAKVTLRSKRLKVKIPNWMRRFAKSVRRAVDNGRKLVQRVGQAIAKKALELKEKADAAIKKIAKEIKESVRVIREKGLFNIIKESIRTGIEWVKNAARFIKDLFGRIPNINTYCMEFKCENGQIMVNLLGKYIKCKNSLKVNVGELIGFIKCPPKEILCGNRYFWNFGGSEIGIKDNEEKIEINDNEEEISEKKNLILLKNFKQ